MADFTAVIRRAVEGLPDNTPELRARVYEKARTAVIRQMENMNPRPPEALIKRQIDKIDSAIEEVESEFAEALPPEAEEEPFVEPAEPDAPEAVETPSAPEEPEAELQPDDGTDDAPAYYPDEEEDAPEAPETVDEPEYERAAEYEEPPSEARPTFREEEDAEQQSRDAPEAGQSVEDDVPPAPYRRDLREAHFDPVPSPVMDEPEDEPEERVAEDSYTADAWENRHDAYAFDKPDEPLDVDSDINAHALPVADDEDDDIEDPRPNGDWSFGATTASQGAFEPAPPPPRRPVPEKDWAHVDSLLGLEPEEPDSAYDDYSDNVGDPQLSSFDEEKGRRKGLIMAVVGLVVIVVLAIGGYFGWSNRDSLIALISPVDVEKTQTEPDVATQPQTTAPEAGQETASAETKPFTQRLLPDGNEVDEGLPPAGADSGPAVTVAGQTTGSSSAPANPSSGQATSEPAPPVGAGQKMYLYEEQLGQSVPSSYQGTVEWELKQENNGTDVPEPVIEGTLNVPDAGLSGTITFRRNDDPSLPASHLVDIAFKLSDDFEGGAIENVQRISMKNTEAARGDPLVAVSAKITDDLYMLALNDFEQARAQNLALLRDRNWIDIPVTYRNGRRALLTLEKGTTGMAIFDRAIQEWQALGDITAGGN